MKTDFEIVAVALEQMINGDPAPSIRTPEFAELISAARCIATSTYAGGYQQSAYAQIGCRALALLVNRLVASMNAEREIALARDRSRPLC